MKIKFYIPLVLILFGAFNLNAQRLDLMVRDTEDDIGLEPNTISTCFWCSPDIWVRNQRDGSLDHENPEYNPNGMSYVYVRVTNISNQTSRGDEKLAVYWAKAGAKLGGYDPWHGGVYASGVLMGSPIGVKNIPVLGPYKDTIVEFEWPGVPNPADYTKIDHELIWDNPWHFCLMAEILTDRDKMYSNETSNLDEYTKNNNNVAHKNISILDVYPDSIKKVGAIITVGKLPEATKPYYLEFVETKVVNGKAIFEEAEVVIKLDNKLYDVWKNGGKAGQFIEEIGGNQLIVRGNNAILDNLNFEDEDFRLLNLTFNFLTEAPTEKVVYTYRVIQKEVGTGKVIGGEDYIINRYPR